VLLALAVVVFRTFALEGYMISTGSMAPTLLGYHRRIECPACRFEFAAGAAADAAAGRSDVQLAYAAAPDKAEAGPIPETATCPNCGKSSLRADPLPVTEGDQLLVHKEAFAWRGLLGRGGPRRWEVAVFRNPEDETLAYVKRVVGLPGERIELIDGDVLADGALQHKPFSAQLGTRIAVHAQDHEPDDQDPDWRPRWTAEADDSSWSIESGQFVLDELATHDSPSPALDWLAYRHWVRRGGTHRTSVPLANWPAGVDPPDAVLATIVYQAEAGELSCYGALPYSVWEQWDAQSEDAAFRLAIRDLYERSHVPPVTDEYAYNGLIDARQAFPVRDLMLEAVVEWSRGEGALVLELSDGRQRWQAEFDFGNDDVVLFGDDSSEPLARARLPVAIREQSASVVWSTFDQHLVLAVNGEPLLESALPDAGPALNPDARRSPEARIGASNLRVSLSHVKLYRDIYYTPPDNPVAEYQLGRGEYFVLGDNSPVSIDSRHWDRPGVPLEALIGKPLLVHLPSRPGTLTWGGQSRRIRVPDISRIRYIR
jgi:signal peptidase I